jgi:hypothetical protein
MKNLNEWYEEMRLEMQRNNHNTEIKVYEPRYTDGAELLTWDNL